jgi:hypothetical protein
MDGDAVFFARHVGTVGCEIVGPEGVVAWTVDAVLAALLVSLLNRTVAAGDVAGTGACDKGGTAGDDEETARRAIEWLADHTPVVTCTFPASDPPSAQVKRLVEPYLRDAGAEVGDLLSRYVMRQLADDHPGLCAIETPDQGQERSAPP